MGAIATILPLALEAFKLVPTLVNTGKQVYDGIKEIWAGVTSEEAPTPEQQAEYNTAEQAAFHALMGSTKDVAEEGDLER